MWGKNQEGSRKYRRFGEDSKAVAPGFPPARFHSTFFRGQNSSSDASIAAWDPGETRFACWRAEVLYGSILP